MAKIFAVYAFALMVLLLGGCFQACTTAPTATVPVPPREAASPTPQPQASGTPVSQPTAVLSVPGFKPEWTAEIMRKLSGGLLDKMNVAKDDMVRFCPKYKSLSTLGQAYAWAYLMSGIASFESNYHTVSNYPESNGAVSRGLFQLSYGDAHCPKSVADGSLDNPITNIDCAVEIMADDAQRDGVIAGGGYVKFGAPPAKGLARYWSCVRIPDSNSHHHLSAIMAFAANAPGCK